MLAFGQVLDHSLLPVAQQSNGHATDNAARHVVVQGNAIICEQIDVGGSLLRAHLGPERRRNSNTWQQRNEIFASNPFKEEKCVGSILAV
jgi:hypothetical protein